MQNDKGSRGQMYIAHMFNAEEIGISLPEPHPDRALRTFLDIASPSGGTAIAPRVSQMPKGILFLSAVDGQSASGAIYIFSRDSGQFYVVMFTDAREYDLTIAEYEQLALEYGLLEYAAKAHLIDECFASNADTGGKLFLGDPGSLAA